MHVDAIAGEISLHSPLGRWCQRVQRCFDNRSEILPGTLNLLMAAGGQIQLSSPFGLWAIELSLALEVGDFSRILRSVRMQRSAFHSWILRLEEEEEETPIPPDPPPPDEDVLTIKGGMTGSNQPLFARLGRQVPDYQRRAMEELHAENQARRDAILTPEDYEAYQVPTLAKIKSCFGPDPDETPLNPQITGTLSGTGYTIQKVLIESMPGWWIPANLYIPDSAFITPAPGVLISCGHDTRAKWEYQTFAQGFAKLGYCALIYDPVGAGERLQVPSNPVTEHKLIARQLQLVGWSMAGLQRWDSRRALDYLCSRTDVVDTNHIGATGTSGGGTQTVWITATDERITMAGPSCFVNTFVRNSKNELWADGEQLPPGAVGLGLDIHDFLLVRAGISMAILGAQGSTTVTGDFFDPRGTQEIYDVCRRVWVDVLGYSSQSIRIHFIPTAHQLNKENREQVYQQFNYAVGGGHGVIEPAVANLPPVPPSSAPGSFPVPHSIVYPLDCTPERDVGLLPGAIRSTGLMARLADAAAIARGNPTGATLINRILQALKMPDDAIRVDPPDFSYWPGYDRWTNDPPITLTGTPTPLTPPNYPKPYCCDYMIETEPEILTPLSFLFSSLWVSLPPKFSAGTAAILYVSHLSADQELSQQGRESLITTIIAAAPTTQFTALDVRGTGQSANITNCELGSMQPPVNGDDFIAQAHTALGTEFLGRITWDVLRALDMLEEYGFTNVHLIGRGNGASAAALAGLLHPNVTKVTLKNALTSWDAAARIAPNQVSPPATRLPFGVLPLFDLPNVYAALAASKTFVQISPVGP